MSHDAPMMRDACVRVLLCACGVRRYVSLRVSRSHASVGSVPRSPLPLPAARGWDGGERQRDDTDGVTIRIQVTACESGSNVTRCRWHALACPWNDGRTWQSGSCPGPAVSGTQAAQGIEYTYLATLSS